MGWWSAYFFAKLVLYAGGYINFDVWWNLLFAMFTALPARNDRQSLTKNLIGSVLAVILLYHDSWLPPITRVVSQTGNLAEFSLPYLVELLGRFISIKVLLQLGAMLVIYAVLKRKLRMSTFVFFGIIAVMLVPLLDRPVQATAPTAIQGVDTTQPALSTLGAAALNDRVATFYRSEQQRQVQFPRVASDGVPYDVVILHVCSLSWDDLEQVGRRSDALLQRFDVLFNQFNSAASYSGPAAIRLLRGNCGQSTHRQLYESPQRNCLVMDGLQDAGFEPHWVMNHDGHFGEFFADVHDRGGMPVALEDSSGATVAQRSFDESPIYDDYSVLSRWWQKRLANPAERVALYYNTISLHDGNRLEGKSLASSGYATRLNVFMSGISRFIDDVQKSGRKVIVVLVPEHGAAVRGDRRQIQGLREIPTPAITHVPVGVMLVNAPRSTIAQPVNVSQPSSYLAVNELLSRFMVNNPFSKTDAPLSDYIKDLPVTHSFAENDGTLVVEESGQSMVQTPDGAWSSWDKAI